MNEQPIISSGGSFEDGWPDESSPAGEKTLYFHVANFHKVVLRQWRPRPLPSDRVLVSGFEGGVAACANYRFQWFSVGKTFHNSLLHTLSREMSSDAALKY